MANAMNAHVAALLEETAAVLEQQDANAFRVAAYRRAARTVRSLERPVADLLRAEGMEGLERLPAIGVTLARAIRDIVDTGRLPMLERLRGETDAVSLLATVPGIGRLLAERLHHDYGIDSLEDLEVAAHDGRLAAIPGFGEKRVRGIREALATRLAWGRRAATRFDAPPVEELLRIDREYRAKAAAGELRLIAPRRFNRRREAWLPVLHAWRGDRHYTALFSNTARAHELGKTHEWVVLYADGGQGERQYTVVTARRGPLKGKRVVRGREMECLALYRGRAPSQSPVVPVAAG
jgi:DNA polymerase (family 10)